MVSKTVDYGNYCKLQQFFSKVVLILFTPLLELVLLTSVKSRGMVRISELLITSLSTFSKRQMYFDNLRKSMWSQY